jgi:crotonobetainyl-CoA:carnitine CoA-transferase CaiB-like acyl-CoA transferase
MAKLPLEGIRIVDLGGVWAGTFSTVLLADLGAEVLKVENQYVWQPNTRAVPIAHIQKSMTQAGPGWINGFPNNDPGERPWNYHPMFVSLYRNKRSFTVDIRRPEGLAILGRLVAMSDAVLENSAVGTMEKLGITYDWLRQQKDDIIFLRAPGYGLTGEYATARTMGAHLEGVMGHQVLRGYRDGDPSMNSGIFAADYIAATQIAFAIMAAIWHRNNTGRGQFIEMAQAENAAAMFAQAYMNYALNGVIEEAIGNRSIYAEQGEAPCGVYPCLSPGTSETGDDRWIAINVTNDAEWVALRQVMGDPDWAKAPELQTAAGRAANQDLLDERIAEWTKDFDDYELFHRLQAAGVPAAPVLEASRVLDDPHVQAHNLYQPQRLVVDDIGEYRYPRPIYEFPESPGGIRRPPVAFGQDNDYVYRELLKVSDEEYDRLVAEGHIATMFDPSIP